MRIANWFGKGNYFITTSNCDQLHVKAGAPAESLYEIHGTVSKVQCANQCCDDLWPVDARYVRRASVCVCLRLCLVCVCLCGSVCLLQGPVHVLLL